MSDGNKFYKENLIGNGRFRENSGNLSEAQQEQNNNSKISMLYDKLGEDKASEYIGKIVNLSQQERNNLLNKSIDEIIDWYNEQSNTQQTFNEYKESEAQSQKKEWPIKNKNNNCLFEAVVPYMYFSSDNDDAESKKRYILNQYKKYLNFNGYKYDDYTINELNLINNICNESINLMTYYNTIDSDISNYINQFKNSLITTNKKEINPFTTELYSPIIGIHAINDTTIASYLDNTLCIIYDTIEYIANNCSLCIMIVQYGAHFICLIYYNYKFYVIDSLNPKIIIYDMNNMDKFINTYHIIIFKEYNDDEDINNIIDKLNQFEMITETEREQNELEQLKREQEEFGYW